MNSSTPDSQPQQQHKPPQTPQQIQPQQQQQQQQQPQQQSQSHQHPHQHPPAAFTMPPYPASYYRSFPPQPYAYHPQYAYAYSTPAAWPQPANYTTGPAQQISNMVTTQPQPNVPQQNNKPASQIINPALGTTDNRSTHNQNLQSVNLSNQAAANVPRARERKPATLKDPATNKEVPLPNKSSTPKPAPSTTETTISNTSTTTTTTTATATPSHNIKSASVEHVHTLLQKVSEVTGKTDKQEQQQQQQQEEEPKAEEEKVVVVVEKKQDVIVKEKEKVVQVKEKEIVKEQVVEKKLDVVKEPEVEQKLNVEKVKDDAKEPEAVDKPEAKVEVEKVKDANNVKKKDEEHEGDKDKAEVEEDEEKEENEQDQDQEEGEEKEKDEEDHRNKLVYETGQYNPVSNRNGKKIYSRQFLLDVCEHICKLDPSQKENNDHVDGSRLQSAFSEKIDMFAPAYSSSNRGYTPSSRQNDSMRRQSPHSYMGRSSGGPEKQRKVITSVSLNQEVELKTTSNPWRPAKDVKEEAAVDTEVVETELLKKKFRSILNKLTPNNFESLAVSVTELHIDTETKLGEVIDIVFAKALAEPGYCVLYGQMCSHLKKISAGSANFGNTLLKRCQHQFQSDIYSGLNLDERREKIENEQDPDVKKQLNEELYEDMYRCRMRGLGLIKFIGELYKIEMLNDEIMFTCVFRLLGDTSEESLECLCDLLVTIGEKLDRSTQKKAVQEKKPQPKSVPKSNAYQGGQKTAAAVVASGSTSSQQQQQKAAAEQRNIIMSLDHVFDQMNKIRKNKDLPLSVRIKFKLLDTIELREKCNWHSKKSKDNNPKKIDEIREAHKEKLEQERRQTVMGPRRSQEGGRRLGPAGGSSSQLSSLANDSSGIRGNLGMHTSASSHLLRDQSISDNMKSNHNDIETQKEHQRKIENFKGIFNTSSKTSSNEPLKPYRKIK